MDTGAYRKSKGSAGLEGVQFQLDLLIVFLSNALRNHKDWKISSENQEAGKYDDLVIELVNRSVFLQSKFKQTKKITRDQLFSCNSKTADFSLPKYFFSYLEIKSEFKEKTVIICTNAEVNPKGLENVLVHHNADRNSFLHCEGTTCSYFTLNENALPDLKATAEIYLDTNLQGKYIDQTAITDDNLKEFLKNFQFFCNYPSGEELHKTIEQLLSLLDDPWCKTSYHEIYRKVEDWFKQPKGEYLTEFRCNAMLCEIRSGKYCESLKAFDVSFDSNALDIAESKGIIHVGVEEGHLLQILKVYYSLESHRSRKLYVNPEDTVEVQKQAVEAFSLRRYTFLIMTWAAIKDETMKRQIISKLKHVLQKDEHHKRIILLANAGTQLAQQFGVGVDNICYIDGSVKFHDLSKQCQERLLKTKNICFQGYKVSLEELLHTQTDKDYTESLDSAMLGRLVRGEEVKVGIQPLELYESIALYYVSRRFEFEVFEGNRRTHTLTDQNLDGVKEKVIKISESAGMGKSTVLTKMATTVKKNNPHLWVIKINVADYTTIMEELIKLGINEIDVIDLLNSLEATKMRDKFEKLVFSISGKVVLMIDGVDEIGPNYTHLVLNLLNHCQAAPNFKKIFVTTRPHVDLKLEEIAVFKMLPFTRLEEIDFLTNYWTHNLHLSHDNKEKCRRYAETLIDRISSLTISDHYRQNPFTDTPLQVRMLAEIFQENVKEREIADWEGCKEYLQRDGVELKLPEKFNIVKLYGTFIEKQRDVFVGKGSPSGSTTATQALLDQFETYLAYHRSLAVRIMLPKYQHLFKTQVPEDRTTEEYILKVGIVQKISERVHFIHRTFGEYFVARSIVEELLLHNPDADFQSMLIEELLLNDKFEIVQAFLDVLLQTVSLPTDIFKKYLSLRRDANSNLIFLLARKGHVAILRLILQNIYFKVVEDQVISVTDWRLRIPFRKRNALTDLAFLVRQAGVNIRRVDGDTPLHLAVKGGHLEMVDFLSEQGANVNLKDSKSRTALHLALYWNNLKIVQCLVKHGADVNAKDGEHCTVLHHAVKDCDLGVVRYLIENGASVNVRRNDRSTMLHLAVASNKLNTVCCLMEHRANVNARDEDGISPLHIAVKSNKMDIVGQLVEHGADVTAKDVESNTPLHLAVHWKNVHCVQYLLDHGAGVNVRDRREQTALHYATQLGELSIVEHLVRHGADIDLTYNGRGTALHLAAYSENWTILKYLVQNGADVLVEDSAGHTVLHTAAQQGESDVAEFLVDHGADVNAGDDEDSTALHFAVKSNKVDAIERLLDHGADVNVKDSQGHTALHLAAYWKSCSIVQCLVEHGADVDLRDGWGNTALLVAVSLEEFEIVEFLVKRGADVNAGDNRGRTALHLAAEVNNMDVVECLLEYGADVNVVRWKGGENGNLLHLVTSLNRSKIVEYLMRTGADSNVSHDESPRAVTTLEMLDTSVGSLNAKFYVNDRFVGVWGYLVEHGDDVNVRDNESRTALHLAIERDLFDLIDYFDAVRPIR